MLSYVDPIPRIRAGRLEHLSSGGKTFTDVTVPLPSYPLLDGATAAVESDVRYDADGTVWLANVGNNHAIVVDKSCEGGTTWSGAVIVNEVNGVLDAATLPGLVPTTTGMAVSAVADADQEARLFRLTP